MDNNLINKVYDFVNHFIHLGEKLPSSSIHNYSPNKICPVTGLDISMQPENSKFLSYTGVKWYYENDIDTFNNLLLTRLSPIYRNKTLREQFKSIAHSVRNTESNPRNYTRRKIEKLLLEKNCLFNNKQLIDQNKLKQAGLI